jgi:Mn-dependent DtxR family transcriptional regulator/Fe2+ transport system protein FeoA
VFFAPKRGLIFQFFQKRNLTAKIHLEDVIKESFKLEQKGALNLDSLSRKLGFKKTELNALIKTLRSKDFFEKDKLVLTEEGRRTAGKLTRAHRLWETYLVNEVGLTDDQIHEDAERLEHLLSEELLDEVDAHLGFPQRDPHGSLIPSKTGLPLLSLSQLELGNAAVIAGTQISQQISASLWKLGVLPDSSLTILEKDKDAVQIKQGDKTINIPANLAARIAVKNA